VKNCRKGKSFEKCWPLKPQVESFWELGCFGTRGGRKGGSRAVADINRSGARKVWSGWKQISRLLKFFVDWS
jgi:hypothetical protein